MFYDLYIFKYNNIYIPEQPNHFFPVITLHALDKLHLHCCACFTCGKHMEKQHVAWPPRLMASTQRKTDVGSWIFFRSVSVGPSCKMSIRKSEVSSNQYGLQHRSTIGNYRTCQPTQEDIINHLSWSAASAPTGPSPVTRLPPGKALMAPGKESCRFRIRSFGIRWLHVSWSNHGHLINVSFP